MTALIGVAAPAATPVAPSPDPDTVAPSLASGVELLGEMPGSGHRRAPGLVRRADGQTIQVTPLLYRVLEAIDGRRGLEEIAAVLSDATDREVAVDDVRFLLDTKLRPLGVLRGDDGAEPAVKGSNPLLALRFRYVVSDPATTRRITAPFAALFRPAVVLAFVTAFVAVMGWLAVDKGLASATRQAFYEPGLLLLVVGLTLVSAGFHEFGHAAACRYGGASPGAMGVGLYLVWPVFFTEVTDSYRLGRGGRLRVDLGGLYFNAVFAVAVFGVWAVVRWDALLLVLMAQLLQMIRQLAPFVRFDGYHILADLTGVPDLFAHIKPTLSGLVPWRRGAGTRSPLKPWARVVVTLWVLAVVPFLITTVAVMVVVFPRVAATAWDSLGLQWDALQTNWADGDVYGMGVRFVSAFAITLPVLGMSYLLVRMARRGALRAHRVTDGRPLLRGLSYVAAVAVLAGVAWMWSSQDRYRPIEAGERGALGDLLDAGGSIGGERAMALASDRESLAAASDAEVRPQRVLLLTPRGDATAPTVVVPLTGTGELSGERPWLLSGDAPAAGGADEPQSGWVFPFDRPEPPGEGDNQALAVNTTDGSTVYDVAIALVWVTDGSVEESNEAYAIASCKDCETVAVAFQVVMVVGHADLATPTNAAVAVNYDCIECTTYAIARQLVLTLTEMPGDDVMAQLTHIWTELETYLSDAELVPLADVYLELQAVEAEIIEVLDSAGGEVVEESDAAVEEGSGEGSASTTSPPATDPPPAAETSTSTSTSSSSTSSTTSTTAPEPTTTTAPAPAEPDPAEEPSAP